MIFNDERLAERNGDSCTVSLRDWMLLGCLNLLALIPIIGALALIVLYIVLAANDGTSPSVRNYLVAALIWTAIWLVVAVVLLLLYAAGVIDLSGLLGTTSTSTTTSSLTSSSSLGLTSSGLTV